MYLPHKALFTAAAFSERVAPVGGLRMHARCRKHHVRQRRVCREARERCVRHERRRPVSHLRIALRWLHKAAAAVVELPQDDAKGKGVGGGRWRVAGLLALQGHPWMRQMQATAVGGKVSKGAFMHITLLALSIALQGGTELLVCKAGKGRARQRGGSSYMACRSPQQDFEAGMREGAMRSRFAQPALQSLSSSSVPQTEARAAQRGAAGGCCAGAAQLHSHACNQVVPAAHGNCIRNEVHCDVHTRASAASRRVVEGAQLARRTGSR